MKSALLALILIITQSYVYSQNIHVIDSLKAESLKYHSDSNKINILNQLSWAYGKKLDTALIYSDSALALSNQLNYRQKIQETHFKKGLLYYNHAMYNEALANFYESLRFAEQLSLYDSQSQSAFQIANVYKDQGTYDKALNFYEHSLSLDKKYNNVNGEASCLNNIGLVYWMQDSYQDALDYFLKSMEIKEQIGDKRGIAGGYVNIGVIYYSQKNYTKAIEYWEKSQPLWEELKDNRGLVEVLNNIGAVYSEQKEHDKALLYLNKSLKIKEQLGDKKAISMTYSNIGEVYMIKKDLKKAFEYFAKAIKINEEIQDFDGLASAHLSIAGYYKEIKDYENALEYAEKGLAISKKIGALSKLKSAYLLVSEIYEAKGDNANALVNHKLFYEINDSIYQKNNSDKLAEIQTKYETEKNIQEIEQQKVKLELNETQIAQNKFQRNIFISAFALFLIISILAIWFYLKIKKKKQLLNIHKEEILSKNIELQEQKEELRAQNEQFVQLNKELDKLSVAISESANAITIFNIDGTIEFRNKAFLELYGKTLNEVVLLRGESLSQLDKSYEVHQHFKTCLETQKPIIYLQKKINEENIYWIQTTLTPVMSDGSIKKVVAIDTDITKIKQAEEEITKQNEILEQEKLKSKERNKKLWEMNSLFNKEKENAIKMSRLLEEKNKHISDSINYALKIQEALLPNIQRINKYFTDSFILFKPRDVVSGDFYWIAEVEKQIVITVADCTGHGVPGAFMSMLGMSILKEIVIKEYITMPSVILKRLRKEIINILHQTGAEGEQKDGMDMALCTINYADLTLQYAGANNSIYLFSRETSSELLYETEAHTVTQSSGLSVEPEVRTVTQSSGLLSNEPEVRDTEPTIRRIVLQEVKPNKMPIAIYEKMDNFTNQELKINSGDALYLFSDGYTDQFGSDKDKKITSKRFKLLLSEIQELSMTKQKIALEKFLFSWKNSNEQTDDITVLGLKL